MSKKIAAKPIIRLYSQVGAPELVFFICLIAMFFIPFIFNTNNTFIEPLLFTLFAFSLEYLVISWKTKFSRLISIIIILAILFSWLRLLNVIVTEHFLSISEILILLISFYFISKSIFASKNVDLNTLLAAVSGYLLIGMALGIVVYVAENAFPNYFSFSTDFSSYDSYYYSFVTMSTLGYGDIAPTNRGGKGLAILITLIGQFYMVIVMGLIIGKLLASNKSDK